MIHQFEISFFPRPKDAAYCHLVAGSALRWMESLGYILGRDQLRCFHEGTKRVALTAWFVGKGAWRHAVKTDSAGDGLQSVGELVALSTKAPKVVELKRTRGGGGQACRCTARAKTPLELRCMPATKAPPLVCSKDGVTRIYELLSGRAIPAWFDALEWNRSAAGIWEIYEAIRQNNSPYRGWSKDQIWGAKSELNRQGRKIAAELSAQLGREVRYAMPPIHLDKI